MYKSKRSPDEAIIRYLSCCCCKINKSCTYRGKSPLHVVVMEWGQVHEAVGQLGSSVNKQMERNADVHVTSPIFIQSMTPSYRMVFSTLRLGCFHTFTFHTSCSALSESLWRDSGTVTPCLYSAAVLWHHGIKLHDLFKTASFMPTQSVALRCCCHVRRSLDPLDNTSWAFDLSKSSPRQLFQIRLEPVQQHSHNRSSLSY